MSSTNPMSNLIIALLNRVAEMIPDSLVEAADGVIDFAVVRLFGLPFIVLGYRQTGKTTLLQWLQDRPHLAEFSPEPTAAGGEAVLPFTKRVDDERMRLRPMRDVGGEYAMWETDWVDLLKNVRPRGIIFMIDHDHPYHHKDALNFVLQMIDENVFSTQQLKYFMLLANKADLWADEMTLDELMDDFRNETRRLKSQSERIGYGFSIEQTSLVTGEGVEEAMVTFFNAIRPRSAVR
ncbi:MAG: hypothetical protein GYB64_19410 [Chloroflexi bacterium]|nr:hypothetical protein [Chloroflexota bacterium]